MKEALVVGVPRSGTTYMYRSLSGLPQGDTAKGNFTTSNIAKAHSACPPMYLGDPFQDFVEKFMQTNGKIIFMFGDPVQSIISTILKRNEPNHFKNCGCFKSPKEVDLTTYDHLNYEHMFVSWMESDYKNLVKVRYEALFNSKLLVQSAIEDFMGREVNWLPLKPRNVDKNIKLVGKEAVERIQNTYSRLIELIKTASDFKW